MDYKRSYLPLMLGAYCPPREELMHTQADADRMYADLAAAGINMVTLGLGEKRAMVIAACEKNGVKFLPFLPESWRGEYLEAVLASPNFMGFNMRDEPPADAFAALAAQKNEVRAELGDRLLLLNLFPNYATAEQLGTDGSLDQGKGDPADLYFPRFRDYPYRDHVRQFLDTYSPDVLCYDFYAIDKNTDTDEDWMRLWNYGLIKNMSTVAAMSLEKGIPFWSVLQAWGYCGKPAPDISQLRWQLGLNFAFGAAGLLYFVYQNIFEEYGGGETWHDAPLKKDGEKTAEYDLLRRANAEFASFYPAAVGYEHKGVLLSCPDWMKFAVDSSIVLSSFAPVKSVDSKLPLVIGCAEKGGKKGLFVANADYKRGGEAAIELDRQREFVINLPFFQDHSTGDWIILNLEKGQSAFIEIAADK